MKKLFLSVVALMAVCTLSAQSVTELYNEGAQAYTAKNYAAAIPFFEKVIDQGMDSENQDEQNLAATVKQYLPNCHFQLGVAALKAKNYDEALAKANQALELATVYEATKVEGNANRLIGMIYQAQGGEAFNNKDYAAAADIFEKGYAADPKNAQMANWLATCYCETGRYAEGLAILKKVGSNRNPKYAEQAAEAKNLSAMYTNNMVAEFQQNNDFDGMIAVAEQMLAEDAESPIAHKIRVQAYNGKKDYNKVIELADEAAALQTDPEDASYIYYLQGSAYNTKEMKPQAIAALKKVTAGSSVEAAKTAIAELSK